MATFTQVGGLQVTFVWIDKSKNRATSVMHFPAGTLLADAQGAADALAAQLELASDAEIRGYTISAQSRASGATAPVAGGNVEQKGVVSFLTAAGKPCQFSIPAPKVTMMTAEERYLNTADAVVAQIISIMTAGHSGTEPCDSNGEDLVSLIDTYVRHRKSTIG